MSLIGLLLFIVVVGLVVWLVNSFLPLPPPFKTIIVVVAVIVVILVCLQAFGVFSSVSDVPVPRID